MSNKIKNFFKLNNWKRWTILSFSFIFSVLFIGLSFGLKTKNTKFDHDYKNGISLVIKPTTYNGDEIDESYAKQLLFNLKNRLENKYQDSIVDAYYENGSVLKIDITNIQNKNDILDFEKFLIEKKPLTLLPINQNYNDNYFQDSVDNNYFFYSASLNNGKISLTANTTVLNEFYKTYSAKLDKDNKKIIIWKNYEILKEIVEQARNKENFDGSMYEFLFVNGWTPEEYESKGDNDTTRPPIFKDELILEKYGENGNVIEIKKYKPLDFIVSKNLIDDFKEATSLSLNKDFGVSNGVVTNKEIEIEYYDISYWISDYSLENYTLNHFSASNGSHAYTFLLIALISFFAIISIFIVINYGYLGIIAIIILAVIIFLSLLMITVFFGDYDSIAICALLLSTIIALDFIVTFFEKIKREFFKGNSISKSVKNTIKESIKSMILKSIILILSVGGFYIILSLIFGSFSIITLIACFAILLILIPLLVSLSNIIVGIKQNENNPKLIGLWSKKYQTINTSELQLSTIEELNLDETIQVNSKNNNSSSIISNYKTKQWFKYISFKKQFESRGWWIIGIALSYVLIFGLIIFLVSFFVNGQTLRSGFHNISIQDKEQTILRVFKPQNEQFDNKEVSNIKDTLKEFSINNSDIKLIDQSTIEINLNKNYSSEKINELSNKIYSLYNVIIIPSKLITSNTFEIMKYTMYGILLAIIVMCLFVLLWMNWTKALSLLIVSLVSTIAFVFMVAFGLIEINPLLSVAAIFGFVIFLLSSINVITKIHYKLKTTRIEEMMYSDIKDLVSKQLFKLLKPSLLSNGITLLLFIIFAIFAGSLPLTFSLFMISFIILNWIIVFILLPKIIIIFESWRAKIKRKIILENYWDTEKVKEQTFKGINNIK